MIRLTLLLAIWAGWMKAADAQPILVLIGGNHSDPSPAQLTGNAGRGGNSGLWRLKGDLVASEKWDAEYFNWNGTRAGRIDEHDPGGAARIANWIRRQHSQRPEAPIILVGNSWGGHTAWQVCKLLSGADLREPEQTQPSADNTTTPATADKSASDARPPASVAPSTDSAAPVNDTQPAAIPVDLVIFLDPSSFGRTKEPMPTALPANVARAVNYFTHNSFGWGSWLDDPRLTNVDLGDPAEGYLMPNGPRYDSRFDFKAHVAAEWDERIHAAIRKEIVAAVGEPENE